MNASSKRGSRGRVRRGFTLIEMMIVVAIVAIMAAAAAPSVIRIIQDRRSQKEALSLMIVLQDAHSRAYGRGAAVVGTYVSAGGGNPPRLSLQESLSDITGDGSGDIPNPACNGTLGPSTRFWQPGTVDAEDETTLLLQMNGNGNHFTITGGAAERLCFTPRGRTRVFANGQWQPVTEPISFSFTASGSSGVTRVVNLFPNGTSRLRL